MTNLKWMKHIFKENITLKNGKQTTLQTVAICLQDKNTNLYLVSPFTSFITNIYGGKKTTSQIAAANVVVAFLNYIYFSLQKNIEEIEYQDAIDFLNTKDVERKTKNGYACVLTKFYIYLQQHDMEVISCYMDKEKFEITGYKNVITEKRKQDVIHSIKTEYLPLFIQCAKEVAPDIALGVFLQLFGGLRCSEVVSIEYSNISISAKDSGIRTMYVGLYDKDLRPDLTSAFTAKVKVNRRQEIIPAFGNMLFDLYDTHRKKYKKVGCLAVFIDSNGNPMTAKTYARKFKKVKTEFIKILSESDNITAQSYAIYLSNYKWSTHIGRGVFSNLIADNSNNVSEIAAWRGDKSLASSLSYLNDNQVVSDKVLKVLNELYKGDGIND